VKGQYVNSLSGIDSEGKPLWNIKYYLGEKLRKTSPTSHNIAMEGK